ncbi:hypothetical protein MMC20_001470 [Loxospora ochrophaea]|nr:hypothetical protein [Loxospora ochrophaea]
MSFLLTNFSTTTLMLAGACAQSVLSSLLPRRLALLPAILILTTRLIKTLLISTRSIPNSYENRVVKGRFTAQIPNDDGTPAEKPSNKSMVVFVIGVSSNHPLGLLAPGFRDMGDSFFKMWDDAAANKDTSGLLGHTGALWEDSEAADTGKQVLMLSYWKDLESLHTYAQSPLHRQALDLWNKRVKTHPHLGIMHEVYNVPKGGWENIYWNSPKTAMGQTNLYPNRTSPLVEAKGAQWGSMLARMGRKAAN